MGTPLRLLLVEDSEDDALLLQLELRRAGFDADCRRVETAAELQAALTEAWDVVVSDYRLPTFSGPEALRLVRSADSELPFIMVSGKIGEELAVEAMRAGASDCVMKDNLPRLGPTVQRELQQAEERRARRRADEAERQQRRLAQALADTAAALSQSLDLDEVLDRVLDNVERVSSHDAAAVVLVEDRVLRLARFHSHDHSADALRDALELDDEASALVSEMSAARSPLVFTDTFADPVWMRHLSHIGWIRSVAAVPIHDGDRSFGILALLSATPGFFTDEQASCLEGFAYQASIAVRNAQLFQAVSRHRTELRQLSERIVNAQEEERARISRELHDEIGQALTAIIINTEFLGASLPVECPPPLTARLAETRELAKGTLEQIRGLSLRLRPPMLDDLGLLSALRWYTERWAARTGLRLELETVDLEDVRLAPAIETTLYRVVQEALTNVARHAGAHEVRVELILDDGTVHVRVEDDGVGFEVASALGAPSANRGLGLLGMRERITSLGGTLEILSEPGKGTRLRVTVPR